MPKLLTAIIVIIFSTSSCFALELAMPSQGQIHSSLSLQPYSGILNTPNAFVVPEGLFQGSYTNQKEYKWRDQTQHQDSYLFLVGFFNFLEIGGELVNAPGAGVQDFSASAKMTSAPLTVEYPYLPVLSAGMQDLGGGKKFLQNKYLVITEELWPWARLSVGYGFGPDRMKGAFGGAELKAHDWVYLLGEYDAKDCNAGVRVVLPYFFDIPIGLTATAKTALNHNPGRFDISVGLNIPLDFTARKPERKPDQDAAAAAAPAPSGKPALVDGLPATPAPPPTTITPVATLPLAQRSADTAKPAANGSDLKHRLEELRGNLIAAGMLNVRVGSLDDGTAVVEYENAVYNHNELDALGVVAGISTRALKGTTAALRIVLKKKDIPMMKVESPLPRLDAFLESSGSETAVSRLEEVLTLSTDTTPTGQVTYIEGDSNSGMFATSLVLFPGLSTLVGTEYGTYDYVLSMKINPQMNLWQGGLLSAQWDVPLIWSDNFDSGKIYANRRLPTRLERLMLQQGIKLLPDLFLNVGAGVISYDNYGTLNEAIWQPEDGSHRIRFTQAWGSNQAPNTPLSTAQSYLASYRYRYAPLDLALEVTGGRFWYQDQGYKLELQHFFGDTAVSIYYKNSITKVDNKHWEAVGIQFSFPLTPAKDMNHLYKAQLRGTEQWSYYQESTLRNKNGGNGKTEGNYIPDTPLGTVPNFTGSADLQYLNRDRLNTSYVRAHLPRLRDSWQSYQLKHDTYGQR